MPDEPCGGGWSWGPALVSPRAKLPAKCLCAEGAEERSGSNRMEGQLVLQREVHALPVLT